MARKKANGLGKELFDLVVLLPWWVGVSAAAISYVALHWVAAAEVGGAAHQAAPLVAAHLLKALAFWGQYLLPVIFLVAALGSALRRRKRGRLVASVANDGPGVALREMAWDDFERLIGEMFRMRGYSVLETGGAKADGGVDLRLRKEREIFLVQCKHWRAYKVPVQVVRELYGVMAAEGASGGFVVTSGTFTAEAVKFADGRNVDLVNGTRLTAMLSALPSDNGNQARSANLAPSSTKLAAPPCPRCNHPMVKRVAKQGNHAGMEFWGCSTYPKCRGTRPVSEPGGA
ncbi:restriction endonuclease [Comamonas badia]|uniref:restriction endonuclease n=1 Tax=Comamonas badia TaxID=265291 RepID=UPI0004675B0A|nr:restriction endonuclease [Comamonas badia]